MRAPGRLVPGLPDQVVDRVLERADGVPLYAVETVRMLLSEGHVVLDGAYRPHRRSLAALGARIAPRAHRVTAGCVGAGQSVSSPGGIGHRQLVQRQLDRGRRGPGTRRGVAEAARPRPARDAERRGRPAVAWAGGSRLRPGLIRRWRTEPSRAVTGGGTLQPRATSRPSTTRGSLARWPSTTWPPTEPNPMGRRAMPSPRRRGSRCAARPNGRARSAASFKRCTSSSRPWR